MTMYLVLRDRIAGHVPAARVVARAARCRIFVIGYVEDTGGHCAWNTTE